MAGLGRGRGRGKGYMSFSIEAVGIGKGENLPPSILQPTPLFPPMEHKPVPLVMGEEAEYMLALKQEFRGNMKTLPFYVRQAVSKKDVERYSDKYQNSEPSDNTIEWNPGESVASYLHFKKCNWKEIETMEHVLEGLHCTIWLPA